MSPTASLDTTSVIAEPGAVAAVPLQILNSGSTVEEYRFEVVGACAPWTTVEPESLSLYPGASGTVTVRLSPPRDPSVPAGEAPFGIRVTPTSAPGDTAVPEGRVTVTPFTEVTAELVPRGSQGALRGRHRLAVDNRGNAPVTVQLSAATGTERARVEIPTPQLAIPVGHAGFGKLRVRPARRMWRGVPVTHTFQVFAAPDAAAGQDPYEPVVLDGSYEQQPILPRWLPRAVAAVVVVALALVGLWYALLRPAVKSAARDAVTPAVVASAVAKSPPTGGGSTNGATDGGSGASSGGSTGGGGASGGGTGGTTTGTTTGASGGGGGSAAGGTPTSARVEVRDAVGGGSGTSTAYRVPAGKTFGLTDIVVQNPQGDAGTLVVSSQNSPVLRLAMENFRDSDYHFVTALSVPAGGAITMSVQCREVGKPVKAPAPSQCEESLLLGGTLTGDTP